MLESDVVDAQKPSHGSGNRFATKSVYTLKNPYRFREHDGRDLTRLFRRAFPHDQLAGFARLFPFVNDEGTNEDVGIQTDHFRRPSDRS